MKIHPEQQYQLTEIPGGFVISNAGDKVNNAGAKALIVATRAPLAEYLERYLSLREAGKGLVESHDTALRIAAIPKVIKLS